MQFPSFSLFGDGRVVVQGPQIEIYPGPALPNLLVRDVSEEGVQAILEAARVAGLLGEDRHYDNQRIADASTTTFTVNAEGKRHVVSAYALFEGEEAAGSDDREAREALIDFQSKLSTLESWLPQGSVGAEGAFDFDELRIFAHLGVSPSDIPPQKEMDWPLSVSLASFGEPSSLQPDLRCGSISGEDLVSLLPLAQRANQLTPWRSDGQLFSLTFRPLLPDESGCPA